MVDFQVLFNISVSIIGALIGYLVKSIFDAIKDLRDVDHDHNKSLNELRVEIPQAYVSKDEFKQMGDNIHTSIRDMRTETRETLIRIETKIDSKADKS